MKLIDRIDDPAAAERADAAFRSKAAEGNDLDVAFRTGELPVGEVLVAVSRRGLCLVGFDPEPERSLEQLTRHYGSRVLRAPGRLDGAWRELNAYFEGDLHDFDLELDLSLATDFQQRVLRGLLKVPYGRTETYGELAKDIGKPRAARAVGGALNRNPVPIVVPCHRIIGADGSLVGYGGGLDRKLALLELEGALP